MRAFSDRHWKHTLTVTINRPPTGSTSPGPQGGIVTSGGNGGAFKGLVELSTGHQPEWGEGQEWAAGATVRRSYLDVSSPVDMGVDQGDVLVWKVDPNDSTKDRELTVMARGEDVSGGSGVCFLTRTYETL